MKCSKRLCMSKRRQELYVQDILTAITDIEEFTNGMSYQTFIHDKKTVQAVVRNFEIIGEAANNLSPEFKEIHPQIPWREIVSMRNKVLHEYFGIDEEVIWQTILEDIPP